MRAVLAVLLGAIVVAITIAAADLAAAFHTNTSANELIASLSDAIATNPRLSDVPAVAKMKPFLPGNYVMFWRLQKVGSSTILSILMSYAYRYHFVPRRRARSNSFCSLIGKCAVNHPLYHTEVGNMISSPPKSHHRRQGSGEFLEKLAQSIRFKVSLTHEICNFNSQIIYDSLKCAFEHGFPPDEAYAGGIKEVFMVREPLSRIASIYYFWGELFKMEQNLRNTAIRYKDSKRQLLPTKWGKGFRPVLGSFESNTTVRGPLFTYHGQETTPPPLDVALAFAHKFPLRRGFPGPSYSSSAFGMNSSDALSYMRGNKRMMSIVLERLDESLVVLRHFLGWSLADVVVTQPRKALSHHPKISQWPQEAVAILKAKLINSNEYMVYNEAAQQLNQHITDLHRQGVNVTHEVEVLKLVRNRVKKICLVDEHLKRYQTDIVSHGLVPHYAKNKLRDVDDKYYEEKHIFALNGEILCSFDVCGACEAHAILHHWKDELSIQKVDLSVLRGQIETLPTYFDLSHADRSASIHFRNCPVVL